jgi:hypothetical protein
LAQPASNTKDEEASPLVDDAIAKEMVKLKWEVTTKNTLNKMM